VGVPSVGSYKRPISLQQDNWHAVRGGIRHVGHWNLTVNLPAAYHMDSAANVMHELTAHLAGKATNRFGV